ncbi:MAG: LPS export ABC transporter permease LptG [Bdellovibrionota bacterium]|jgi:lipopolysaccharide export system permease protein
MKIVTRYIYRQFLRNLALSIFVLSSLFLFVDFFDRIDNVLERDASFGLVITYFSLKIPYFLLLTLPISMLVASLFTMGLLTRSSELTAMRASGFTLFSLARPIFIVGLVVVLFSSILSETIIPYTQRRVREMWNIDIKQRDQDGHYDRQRFWFREGDDFYSVSMFDSRENALLDLSIFALDDSFFMERRRDARKAVYLSDSLGWNMSSIVEKSFGDRGVSSELDFHALPLPISANPEKFYITKTDPASMSYRELQGFIREQERNGLSTASYLGDLYSKLAFPFINVIVPLLVIPFAVGSSRTKSLAGASVAAVVTGFSYHVIHSLAIALSRAELWPPLLSAWAANILLSAIGIVLFLGAEAPE